MARPRDVIVVDLVGVLLLVIIILILRCVAKTNTPWFCCAVLGYAVLDIELVCGASSVQYKSVRVYNILPYYHSPSCVSSILQPLRGLLHNPLPANVTEIHSSWHSTES